VAETRNKRVNRETEDNVTVRTFLRHKFYAERHSHPNWDNALSLSVITDIHSTNPFHCH
jgi:hypothetical protein